jgi:uncharacterized protein (DUF433 family)
VLTHHLTIRLDQQLHAALARRAREAGRGELTVLARQYIEEGLAMDRYPGIVFRGAGGGRRPALAGRRIDVAHVVQTFLASGNNRAETAAYFGIEEHEVGAAIAYYADHRDEIDGWIEDAQSAADEAQASFERQRQLTQV